jgi:hypothetical protein
MGPPTWENSGTSLESRATTQAPTQPFKFPANSFSVYRQAFFGRVARGDILAGVVEEAVIAALRRFGARPFCLLLKAVQRLEVIALDAH